MNFGSPIEIDVQAPCMSVLRTHALFGDDLAIGLGLHRRWLKARGKFAIQNGRLQRRYATSEGLQVTLDWGCRGKDLLEYLSEAERSCNPAAIHLKWTPFLERVGMLPAFDPEAARRVEVRISRARPFTAARRLAHPSSHVDRLLLGDRAFAAAQVEGLLFANVADAEIPKARRN